KFTEKGQVVLRVEVAPEDANGVELHVAVIDTGVGIPADRFEAIFEPFTQADGSTTRKYGGTGLGLSISARLVELMGGRIWIESELGRGTSFHFTAHLASQGAAELPKRPATEEKPRILLAGGTHTHQAILKEMLTQWRMLPTVVDVTAATLQELERAGQAGIAYAVLLLDISLEESEDPELLAEIFVKAAAARTPVVLLKAVGPKSVAGWRGPEGTITLEKPVRQSRLLETIEELVRAEKRIPLEEINIPESSALFLPGSKQLRVLLVDDNRINQVVGTRLLQRDGHAVTVVGSGEEALVRLDHEVFDVCLMDVQMPGMDGLEATSALRLREKNTGRRLPVIALTAHAMKGDRERCLAAGMDSYLAKPVRPEELRKALTELGQAGNAPAGTRAAASKVKNGSGNGLTKS
ncbi:MAG TPA: response regulator, partial [Gemmataceae bacterium]|nr:response regulator [Gemmataceae bacterium]